MKAPPPANEAGRLQALHRLGILDTAPEPGFDEITMLASHICAAPIALVSLVAEDRQWLKSKVGLAVSETPRDVAFCAHGILEPEFFQVEDAFADERFATNPLVTGNPSIRFYAGARLVTAEGHALGMLCVSDRVPRKLSAAQQACLQALSRQVVAQMELRESLRESRRLLAEFRATEVSLRDSEEKFRQLTENLTDIFWLTSPDLGQIHYVSPAYETIWGEPTAALYANPQAWIQAVPQAEQARVRAVCESLMTDQARVIVEFPVCRADGTTRWVRVRGFQVRDDAGQLVRLAGIVSDITAEREQRILAERRETELRALFDLLPTMVWFKDTGNRILRVNKLGAEDAGRAVAEIEGRSCAEIFPREAARVYGDDQEVIRSRAPKLGIIQLVPDLKGEARWIQTDKVPYCDEQGQVQGIVVVAQDITERKRAEEALRESEERFTGAFENAPIGMALVSPAGHWLKVNRALCELLGYGESELLAHRFQDITCPEDLEADLNHVRQMLAGEIRTYQMEKRYVHARGHLVTVLLHVSMVRDRQGHPLHLIAQVLDITGRKQSEIVLRASEARIRLLVRSSNIGLWDWNLVTNEVFFSPEWKSQLGYADDELPNSFNEWKSRLHPDDLAPTLAAVDDYLAGRRADYEVEFRLRHKSGAWRWILTRANLTRDSAGRPTHIMGCHIDITERQQAEESLRLLGSAIQQSRESMVITEAELDSPGPRIIFVNDAYTRMTGYSAAEAVGRTPRICQGPDTDRAVLRRLRRELESGGSFAGETINYRKDGTPFNLEWQIAPIRNAAGKTTHFVAIQRDVTERKRAAEELLQAKQSAEAANQAKSEFLAMMSHEIRTPMNGVIGFANLLTETCLSAEQSQYVDMITASSRSLLQIINDILDFSKIEAGKMTVEHGALDLAGVVRQCAGLLAIQASQKQLILRAPSDASTPVMVTGDADRIRQVLLNLIGNAVKFTRHGEITIEAGPDRVRPGFVRCGITDTGIGIPAAQQAKLFQLFSQTDSSTTRRYGGTGLGLAISKRLVELMGGQIGMRSSAGEGSTFWFTLPASQGPPVESPEGRPRAPLPASETTPPIPALTQVLLAGGARADQNLAVSRLHQLGCKIDVAANAGEAISLASRRTYDLILLECLPQATDALEATREIRRAEPRDRRAPIVVISAGVSAELRRRGHAAGVDEVIEKPVHAGELARLLRQWTPDPEPPAQANSPPSEIVYENVNR